MDIVIYIALGVLFLILVILANQFLPKLIINQRKKKHEEILRIYSNDINKLKFNCYESLNKLQAQGYPVKLRNLTTLVTLKHKNGYKTAELAYDENQSLMVIFHNDYSIPHAFYCHDLNACEVLINSEEDGGNKLLNAVLFVLHLLINIAFIFFPKIKAALGVASSLIDVGTELIPQSIENVSKLSIKFFFNPYCRKSVENIELINNRTLKSNSKEYKNLLVFARKIKFEVNKLIPKNAQTINYNINVNQGAGASHFQYSNQDAGKATISYNDQQLNVDQGTAGAHYVHVDKNSITAVSYSEPSQHIEQEYVPQKGYQDLHTTSSWEKFQRKQQEKDEKSQSNNPWNQGF